MNSWLYTGQVFHRRIGKKEHVFKKRIFFIRFPLTELSKLKSPLFSVDRWNLFSFYNRDHGNRDGSDLLLWAKNKLRTSGIKENITEIDLQTFPRVLGYVFNPVSFWFCYSGSEQVATIVEVNNTFGQSHSYIITRVDEVQQKVFHVSPFFRISGQYKFSFSQNGNYCRAEIRYFQKNEDLFLAEISGTSMSSTTSNLLKVWLKHPLLTFAVVFFIHWHALILWYKGVPFFGKNGTVKENQ